ncbi:MAG: sugar transferase [Desulfitobacterium sp.]
MMGKNLFWKRTSENKKVLCVGNLASETRLLKEEMEIINTCLERGEEVLLVPDLMEILVYGAELQYVDDSLMFKLKPLGLTPTQRFIKRAFDLIVALILLVIISPFMIFLNLLIPILSPGSPIFSQERLGRSNLVFKMKKFRSMVDNAEAKTGPVLAIEKDPRITEFGSFLRGTRLDELPQLFNVLKGEMSLVGPRPEREFFAGQFTKTIPYYSYRTIVKPGITGLAQVKGKYTTSPEDKLRMDLIYICNYSLGLDIKILLQTVRVVLKREKAAGVRVRREGNEPKDIDSCSYLQR